MESVLGPCVHFVPSGSGSFVKTGSGRVVVLTCAHCVDHNDDYDDDGDAGDASESGDDDETAPARKSRRYRKDNDAAAASATQPVVPIKCDARGAGRVGRCLTMVWPDGEVALTRCLAANDRSDVAIMELLYRESPVGGGIADSVAVASVSASPVAVDTPIVCIHNPYDWDLELKSGATPRRSGYTPFTTSAGSIDGYRTGDRTDASDLGAVIHSAWTYWVFHFPLPPHRPAHAVPRSTTFYLFLLGGPCFVTMLIGAHIPMPCPFWGGAGGVLLLLFFVFFVLRGPAARLSSTCRARLWRSTTAGTHPTPTDTPSPLKRLLAFLPHTS